MITCTICVGRNGFTLADKDRIFESDNELANHMEDVHGIPVAREGETTDQAEERCAQKGVVVDRSICACKDCQNLRNGVVI